MKHNIISLALAMCAHELNRAYCAAMGDVSQLPWAEAPKWQQDSSLAGVAMHLANPDATPEQSHESWLAQKTADGWVYGEVKDSAKKEHPCFLPYAELPAAQKAKDYIFRAAVHSVSAAIAEVQAKTPAQPAAAQAIDPSLIGVTYIHHRDEWADKVYGTGLTFVKGQTRYLPLEVALKLLRHQDLFEKNKGQAPAATSGEPAADDGTTASLAQSSKEQAQLQADQHALMDLHDSVNQMGKDELAQYAMTNFKQTLDKRQKVGEMRAQVNQFLDQFGAV
ncbi:RyR domain-containing protein [Rhodoferax ferrireducens]|uniref:RyR domain-containing protein n=1 Tax=Rhodoferax ferrireducens TaxID=192843 RepID=UPI000E0DEEC7|nr:RyR domain-containing protein [Rhodoferax ferrireducens]